MPWPARRLLRRGCWRAAWARRACGSARSRLEARRGAGRGTPLSRPSSSSTVANWKPWWMRMAPRSTGFETLRDAGAVRQAQDRLRRMPLEMGSLAAEAAGCCCRSSGRWSSGGHHDLEMAITLLTGAGRATSRCWTPTCDSGRRRLAGGIRADAGRAQSADRWFDPVERIREYTMFLAIWYGEVRAVAFGGGGGGGGGAGWSASTSIISEGTCT